MSDQYDSTGWYHNHGWQRDCTGKWHPPEWAPGPGWRVADDGVWYPPDGWRLAIDGNWYPPGQSPGPGRRRAIDANWDPPDQSPEPGRRRAIDANWDPPDQSPGPDASHPAGPPGPFAPPSPAPRPRRRGWLIAGFIALAIVGFGVITFGLDQILTHDLLNEDFSEDDGTFASGETAGFRLEIRDGSYRLTAFDSLTDEPLETFGFFARTAYNVHIQAEIRAFDATDAVVGLECVHSAGGGLAGARYLFTAGTSGDGYQLLLVRDDIGSARTLATVDGPALRAGDRLGLACDNNAITGLINDLAVISSRDPVFDSFKAVALVFGSPEGDWIEWDEVTAVVPEH